MFGVFGPELIGENGPFLLDGHTQDIKPFLSFATAILEKECKRIIAVNNMNQEKIKEIELNTIFYLLLKILKKAT